MNTPLPYSTQPSLAGAVSSLRLFVILVEQGSEDYGNSVLLHEPTWLPFMRFDIRRNEQNVLQQERLNSVPASITRINAGCRIIIHHILPLI